MPCLPNLLRPSLRAVETTDLEIVTKKRKEAFEESKREEETKNKSIST
jgi:hypothetical protein